MITVHKVYWTHDSVALSRDFSGDEMTESIKFCEELRNLRRSGQDISFISHASEIPECTSLAGVDVVGVGYNWKKRR